MAETASRTAEYVALFRAIESARPARSRLFNDPYAEGFLDWKLKMAVQASKVPGLRKRVPTVIDKRWPGPRPSAVVRTKMIDDAVEAGLNSGAEQIAILGAGYDTRGIRIPGAKDVPVFELDRPVTQNRKKEALRKTLGTLPSNIRYVPFDLEDEGVGAPLANAGFEPGRKTIYLWEGVLSYLTEEAIDATLRWVTETGAPGSRLIFTYVDVAVLSTGDGSEGDGEPPWSAAVARVGEPFRYGIDPKDTADFVAKRGLKLMWDTSTAEALATRFKDMSSTTAPNFYRVALAEVPSA